MKKLIRLFIKKEPPTLEECTDFEVNKDDANTLFGGFKEYKPPIYEYDDATDRSFKTTDLFTGSAPN
jgi:hypothetical protein